VESEDGRLIGDNLEGEENKKKKLQDKEKDEDSAP
jgi:hypothetical protein